MDPLAGQGSAGGEIQSGANLKSFKSVCIQCATIAVDGVSPDVC